MARAFAVPIQLTPKQVASIRETIETPKETRDEDAISSVASDLVAKFADGGMMIDARTLSRIDEITGGAIATPRDLIPFVEKGCSVEEGQVVVKWRLDPAWVPALQEVADRRPMTLEALVQEIMDFVVSQGWINAIRIDELPRLTFAPEGMDRLRELVGKEHVTGTDVVRYLDTATALPTLQ
jgi:hypothetical protein